jgi:acylphosphatase
MPAMILTIQGRVQGVFFRANIQKKAKELNLLGYVQNKIDSDVEILAVGTDEQINKLIAFMEANPGGSKVTGIVRNKVPEQKVEGFKIRY